MKKSNSRREEKQILVLLKKRGVTERSGFGKRGRRRLKEGRVTEGESSREGGEGEGGEEIGRGRERGGVIVGGRGGDSLVDGQKKDKGE